MPIIEINIIPIGSPPPSVSKHIRKSLEVLKKEARINYELTAMDTIIEAESLDLLLNIAKKMHLAVFNEKIRRVVTTIKIDDRKDKKSSIKEKIDSVSIN